MRHGRTPDRLGGKYAPGPFFGQYTDQREPTDVPGILSRGRATVSIVFQYVSRPQNVRRPKRSPPSLSAWIGSIQVCLPSEQPHGGVPDLARQNAMLFAPGLLFGRWFDRGHLRIPVFVGSAVFVACVFLTAQCTQYWHFILCQGFGMGVSNQLLSVPSRWRG